MRRTWLFVDVQCLAYRAMHTTGDMSYNDMPTGVTYGILRELYQLENTFSPTDIAFAFDSIDSHRKELYSAYKANRMTSDDPYVELKKKRMREEVRKLRDVRLAQLGYKNLYQISGYEADDVIARFCEQVGDKDFGVIVSSDEDMFQLLAEQVCIYNPHAKKIITKGDFEKKYKISPSLWPKVKAIAGCDTDNVKGIYGVANGFASRFVAGSMKPSAMLYSVIAAFIKTEHYDLNLKLCSLPFDDCPPCKLIQHAPPRPAAWNELCVEMGFRERPGTKHVDMATAREGIDWK